jgi:polysaccharide export outer membrane protein
MNKIIQLFIFISILTSCASKKNIHYFINSKSIEGVQNNFNPILKTGDLLNISVFSLNTQSAEPFNLPYNTSTTRPGYNNGIASNNGYLIKQNGEIDFPVIGNIKLVDLNITEANELIKLKLKDFIKDPIISIHIQNFKITVLGEVKNPGTFQIPNERITILEAIGLAGDLTINGIRKDIILIRDQNGIKTETLIDLTSKKLFNSEYYYLSQNDVLYIKPNQTKVNSSAVNSSYGIFISVASLIITTINLITK